VSSDRVDMMVSLGGKNELRAKQVTHGSFTHYVHIRESGDDKEDGVIMSPNAPLVNV